MKFVAGVELALLGGAVKLVRDAGLELGAGVLDGVKFVRDDPPEP